MERLFEVGQYGSWSVWCKCNSCSVFWRFHRKLSGTSWESRNLTSSVTSQSSKFIPHQFTAKVVVATQQKKKVGPWLLSSWTMGKQVFQAELRFLSETSTTSRSTKPMVLFHWPLSEGQRLGSCNKPWHPSDRFMETLCQLDPIKNAAQKCCATACPPCANPLSSSWPNFATSAFSQPSPVNYTFFTNTLQPKVKTYNESDRAHTATLTSLSWLTCRRRSSPIKMAFRPLHWKDLDTKSL